ncbi:MAG: 3-oxoacyl-[acyl-carrier-protein] synthase III C-terminal domain-containing protein [Planctomycetaceae bacterium]
MESRPDKQCAITDVVEITEREDLFQIVDNEQITEFSRAYGKDGFSSAASVLKSTGVVHRRICRPGINALDIGLAVAEKLQKTYGFSWSDCPAIGLSHSHAEPDSLHWLANQLSDELGIDREKFFGINFGCVGFLELLRLGVQEFNAKGGPVPMLTVEVPDGWHDASDRSFCGIVSSGATGSLLHDGPGHKVQRVAVVAEEVPPAPNMPLEDLFWTETNEVLNFYGQPEMRTVMRMNGGQVFLSGTELMIGAFRKAFASITDPTRRVLVASHQPSGKMLRAMISVLRTEFPNIEFLNNLSHHANSISSTIPTVLSHLESILERSGSDPVQPGDYVLLPAAGICMEWKATHLSQGWAVIEW